MNMSIVEKPITMYYVRKARVGVLYQIYNARCKPSILYLIKHDYTSALNG